MTTPASLARDTLQRLGAGDPFTADGDLIVRTPIDGSELGRLRSHTHGQVEDIIAAAQQAFGQWRTTPAPVRGALVREWGNLLREHKEDLGMLVTLEAGKIPSEGDRKSTRLNSSHVAISYAVFCLQK